MLCRFGGVRELPDMMSALEGRREAELILFYKSDPNADKGEEVKKGANFADIISGNSLSASAPFDIVN